jgi:hypothetical protein
MALCRRNTQAIERSRLVHQPAHPAPLEYGGEVLFEQTLLLFAAAGSEQGARIAAVDTCHHMGGANESAEQAVTIEAALEHVDAAHAAPRAAVPVFPGGVVKMRANVVFVCRNIAAQIGVAEHVVEGSVAGEVLCCGKLQFVQRDMGAIEVERGDTCRIGGQIAHDIAAARSDRDDVVVRLDCQRFHVDDRIFPYLRIYEIAKCQCECALQNSRLGQRLVAVNCCTQMIGCIAAKADARFGHFYLQIDGPVVDPPG